MGMQMKCPERFQRFKLVAQQFECAMVCLAIIELVYGGREQQMFGSLAKPRD
jgi:hypothetical protein